MGSKGTSLSKSNGWPINDGSERKANKIDPSKDIMKEIVPGSESFSFNGISMTNVSQDDTLELYRQNAKKSSDPHVQLEFAKFLIQLSSSIVLNDDTDDFSIESKASLLEEGLKWIKKLASSGVGMGKAPYGEAQYMLAECYGNGWLSVEVDLEKAFSLYIQASKQNHVAATYRAAICYEVGAGTKKDPSRAVQFYKKSAALGDIAAQYKVAMILLNGTMNTIKNEREGIVWLRRAANDASAENPEALHELAIIYEKGGVPSVIQDEKYARELYTKCANLGYAPSQFKLGYCFEFGSLTCEIDARRSIAWYSRAADQGHSEAELALSGWYLTGSENILQQSDAEAYSWARKAADNGFSKAQYAVGYYTEVGIHVKSDLDDAIFWYTKAADQGNSRAKQRLQEIKKFKKIQKKVEGKSLQKVKSDCTIS